MKQHIIVFTSIKIAYTVRNHYMLIIIACLGDKWYNSLFPSNLQCVIGIISVNRSQSESEGRHKGWTIMGGRYHIYSYFSPIPGHPCF